VVSLVELAFAGVVNVTVGGVLSELAPDAHAAASRVDRLRLSSRAAESSTESP
jgi:hypothetical protein